MRTWLKNLPAIIGLALGLYTFSGAAMAFDLFDKIKSDFAAIHAQGEQERAQIRANSQQSGNNLVMTAQSDTSQSKPTQLILPKDKRVAIAMNEAMPTIQKILSIHQCITNSAGMRQMNFFAVPGVDMSAGYIYGSPGAELVGLPIGFTQYHDKNKCLSVQVLDSWSMPALNALLFRAIYFAEDSGETVNFLYLFKKVDDGSWKIAQLEKGR